MLNNLMMLFILLVRDIKMSKLIKIYGERNTNTGYMSELIKLNLTVRELPGIVPHHIKSLQKRLPQKIRSAGDEMIKDIYFDLTYSKNLGWKHTCVKPAKILKSYSLVNDDLAFLTITKNPYSWLLSLYRRPYHHYSSKEQSFEEFLRYPWKTIGRDNTNKILKNPIELWNIKNRSYLQLKELKALNIKTESIFENPNKIFDKICHQFSIKKISNNFFNYERSTKDKRKNSSYYRDYYLNEKWRDKITSDEIAIINMTLDKSLMSYFGYNVL